MSQDDPFLIFLKKKYPLLENFPHPLNIDLLASPYQLPLSETKLSEIFSLIPKIHHFSRQVVPYLPLGDRSQHILNMKVPNDSVLMGYDFHVTEEKTSLIEINTNSSGFLIAEALYRYHNSELFEGALDKLLQSFQSERNALLGEGPIRNLAIVDSQLEKQKMLPEFFMYEDWFAGHNIKNSMIDLDDLSWHQATEQLIGPQEEPIDFVYNRHTDFLLEKPESNPLLEAYASQKVCLSPQPKEYVLQADKQRMIDWQDSKVLDALPLELRKLQEEIAPVLIPTKELSDFDSSEEMWANRKKYYFKPKRSHGAKAVYRGSSISKKAFNDLLDSKAIVAQENRPPGTWTSDDGEEWKFDLRVFAYRDEVQLACARLYQGQLTNFKTPGGGYCALQLV